MSARFSVRKLHLHRSTLWMGAWTPLVAALLLRLMDQVMELELREL